MGTREGGLKTAAKNKMLYGADFYKTIGRMGGKVSGGPFATNRELASRAGKRARELDKIRLEEMKLKYEEGE